ncbi:MAG: hypothetical protein HYV07_22850 [Deltaproteobacteria bacterium]|nr:hypothetical protein [Deltaproteobacteria bacterium]
MRAEESEELLTLETLSDDVVWRFVTTYDVPGVGSAFAGVTWHALPKAPGAWWIAVWIHDLHSPEGLDSDRLILPMSGPIPSLESAAEVAGHVATSWFARREGSRPLRTRRRRGPKDPTS